jgi:hypothetical protein
MINVNQITSQLARMPDPALQKYAEMHKNDPYVMALAMSEFNRRKQMRQGAQANAPEQPKVVDQAIQSMGAPMPEDVGIGQLPAGNMNFAEGGIVAFDEGGKVERYNGEDSSLVGVPKWMRWLYANESPAEKKRREQLERTAETNRRTIPGAAEAAGPLAPEGSPLGRLQRAQGAFPPGSVLGMAQASLAQSPAAQAQIAAEAAQRAQSAAPAAAAPATASGAPAAAAPDAGAGGPRQNTAGRRNTGTPPPAAAAAATSAQDPLIAQLLQPVTAAPVNFEAGQATFPTLEGIQNLFAANKVNPGDIVDPFAQQRQELTSLATLQNALEQSDFERRVKERGQLGEKQEARLKAREEKLGKQEKDIVPLAMLQAGFAIMGGSSRSALQNIGAGAQVGLRGYAEGIERLKASRERIEDGLERIETARRSEGILNDQQRSAIRREGNAIVRDGKRETINALTTEFGIQRERANAETKAGIDMLNTKAQSASAERLGLAQMQQSAAKTAQEQGWQNVRAAVQLKTQERIAGMEADAKKAEAAATRAALERRDTAKTDQELIEIRTKSPLLQQRYPDVNEYLRIMKGTAALQAGQQLNPADQALIQKYLKP